MTHLVRRLTITALAGLISLQAALIALLVGLKRLRARKDASAGPSPRVLPPVRFGADEVRLYPEGCEWHEAALEAIGSARESIWLETFLWHNDALGRTVKEALFARAREGVAVYVIYDWLGTLLMALSRHRFPEHPNLHLLRYCPEHTLNPIRLLRRSGRDHRKLLIVDGELAFLGGYNIGGLYGRWRDTQLRLRGPAVRDLAATYAHFWNRYRHPATDNALPLPELAGASAVRVVTNDRMELAFPIRAMYLQAINRSKRRIFLTQPYLIPDRILLQSLAEAARRGVDVRLLVPSESNHVLATWLSRRHFAPLLAGGVRIFAYADGMLHAKTMTIDGTWSTVGTANLDRLSLFGNNEVNVELRSPELALQLEQLFTCDCARAREITPGIWEARPCHMRAIETILAPLWPLA